MNNDNKIETAIAGLNCWARCATEEDPYCFFKKVKQGATYVIFW